MFRLMPKQQKLFECFEQMASLGVDAAKVLREILAATPQQAELVCDLEAVEQRGDDANHAALAMLQKRTNFPISREQITQLLGHLDDVIDGADAAAHRLVLYRVKAIKPEAIELAGLLAEATVEVSRCIGGLRKAASKEEVLASVIEVNRLENRGDEVLRTAIGTLFANEPDAIELIKWKELFEILEEGLDACEHVANLVEAIVVENT